MKSPYTATMTLNISPQEMKLLDEMRVRKGMSKTALVRQALKLYQSMDVRMARGERMQWVDKDGNRTDIIVLGCETSEQEVG